jgi:hypothetical protein
MGESFVIDCGMMGTSNDGKPWDGSAQVELCFEGARFWVEHRFSGAGRSL